jgi:CubicO group peptidase (beta-lactamase class C family)
MPAATSDRPDLRGPTPPREPTLSRRRVRVPRASRNPLPVDPDTLFVLGSVTRTYPATALMRLIAQQRVELDAPVCRYPPELVLSDERATAQDRSVLRHATVGRSHR